MHRALVTSLALSACWSGAPPPPTAGPPVAVAPPPRHVPDPPKFSVWEGRYVCSQGPTAMKLSISATPDGAARIRFDFRALPENPAVPSGSYQLLGSLVVTDDGTLELAANPDRWFDQPSGYTMVGIRARSDARQTSMKGRIANDSCGELEVTRLR
ncbi:MAG: hypothetical protein KF773_11695 [Deltaproteobacteria bacterium]|nr:hypothetical protein [Deltaproteobacteria bacterium]